MKLSNLSGWAVEVKDYVPIQVGKFFFFWTPLYGGRLSERKTGMLMGRGTLDECRKKLKKIFESISEEEIEERIQNTLSIEEQDAFRENLMALHKKLRRITHIKPEKKKRMDVYAGDLYITKFPETEDEDAKNIIKEIKKIQGRTII